MPSPRHFVEALLLDVAGTTFDAGSRAPVRVFVELFRLCGVRLSCREARAPMGLEKRAHIRALLAAPALAQRWRAAHGGASASERDVEALFRELQTSVAPRWVARCGAAAIAGVGAALAAARRERPLLGVGLTTGYERALLACVLASRDGARFVEEAGVGATVAADEVASARPAPDMNLRALALLGAKTPWRCVAVGDTRNDIEAGRRAGLWTVGVALSGNALGEQLDEEDEEGDLEHEGEQQQQQQLAWPPQATPEAAVARARASLASAHFVIDSAADIVPVLEEIERRLSAGERPD